MRRILGTVVGFILLGGLASIQWANVRLIAGLASPPSLLTGFAVQASALEHQTNIAENIAWLVPFSTEQQFLASLALQDAEQHPQPQLIAIARARIAQMPMNDERLAALARLAAVEGDIQLALARGIAADASNVVERELDALEAKGQLALAQTWDRRYITSLRHRATDREALAAALWRLACLENRAADNAASKARQLQYRGQALEILRSELRLSPFSGKVLLTAGYAALAVNAPTEAEQHFRAAVQADPASASGYIGLARVAQFQRHPQDFQNYLAKARALAPQQVDVLKLQDEMVQR